MVLLVEDDLELRRLYAHALQVAGFATVQAADGLAALRSLDNDSPDVIVLDIGLPAVDGREVLKELRALGRKLPVLVVTGSNENFDYLDPSCVFRKPLAPENLVTAVAKCLNNWG